MVDAIDLVHMDGRVYDPEIGRFISADTLIQDATDMQAFNRYSYVRNNPLSLTDPSGHSWLKKNLRKARHAVRKLTHSRVVRHLVSLSYPEIAIDEATFRAVGREFVKVPQLQMVADAVATVGGPLAVAAVNAYITAAVTYNNGGNFSQCLRNGAVAFSASAVTGEVGAQNWGGWQIGASMALGGAISKAQGGKWFDSQAFMQGMAVSMAVSWGMKAWNGQETDQAKLTAELQSDKQPAGTNGIGTGDYRIDLVVENSTGGTDTGHFFIGGYGPDEAQQAYGFYPASRNVDALIDFGSWHDEGLVQSNLEEYQAALAGDSKYVVLSFNVNADTFHTVMSTMQNWSSNNDYGLLSNSCFHAAMGSLAAGGLIQSPVPSMSIRPQTLYNQLH